MRRRLLRLCLCILLLTLPTAVALGPSAAKILAPAAARVCASSAFLCVTFCCGSVLLAGSVGDAMYGYAWATTYYSCQDGTQCYTSYFVDCFLGSCSVDVTSSGCD